MAVKRAGMALAFAWGAAEAVVFFVVADVLITLTTARNGFRAGFAAALWATAGALLGGMLLYVWAAAAPAAVDQMLDRVPAVSAAQIAVVKRAVSDGWIAAIWIGGFSGDPYKLYAAAAGEQGVSLLPFLAVSVAARLSRFLASAILAQAVTSIAQRAGSGRWALPLIAVFWIAFYAWYWSRMPG